MPDIREIQLCGLEILKEFVRICDKYGLKYYLSSGTLLGAVRHGGFIPWDNDIDVEMPLEDYYRFWKLAKNELKKGLFLQTYKTDPGYNELWTKIRADGTTSMPVAWKNYHIHLGLGIDIAPIVGLAESQRGRKRQIEVFNFCRTLMDKEYLAAINNPEWKISWKLQIVYLLPWSVRAFFTGLLLRYSFRSFCNSKEVTPAFTRMCYFFRNEDYGEGVFLPFEDMMLRCPTNYDGILTRMYKDYMTPPPEDKRGFGHELKLGKIIYDCHKDYREYLSQRDCL